MTNSVSEEMRRQIIGDLLKGKSGEAIRQCLAIDSGDLHALIDEIKQSDIYQAARGELLSAARAKEALNLIKLSREFSNSIEKIAFCGVENFRHRYLATAQPVVFTDFTRNWPALSWTPDLFRQRFQGAPIEITQDRSADPDYDRNYNQHVKTTTVGKFISRITDAESPTNDFYLIANNFALRNATLSVLLDDVKLLPDLFDLSILKDRASLWVGPAGTITSYHYDPGNIMFCQMFGRKRFGLIPPWSMKALNSLHGYHLQEGNYADEEISVEIGAGDSIFLPAGWFHRVESLTPSISFSTTCFKPHKSYMWYKPGFNSTS